MYSKDEINSKLSKELIKLWTRHKVPPEAMINYIYDSQYSKQKAYNTLFTEIMGLYPRLKHNDLKIKTRRIINDLADAKSKLIL